MEVLDSDSYTPMVAFKCGYKNRYQNTKGNWISDSDRYATCFSGKVDILKYCKRVYPSLDVNNIMETEEVEIHDWCKECSTGNMDECAKCKWTFKVRPYKCLGGSFNSAALQVPNGCRFGHSSDPDMCEDFAYWEQKAKDRCAADKDLTAVRSFSMLEPCGLDLFTGVEYVCCPPSTIPQLVKTRDKQDEVDESEDDDLYYEDDDEDDEEDDEDDDIDDDLPESPKEIEKSSVEPGTDPYFEMGDPEFEHQMYKEALQRLSKRHKQRVDKVLKNWSALEERYSQMKKEDPERAQKLRTEMSQRLDKEVSALEKEHQDEKNQIEEVHQERVQAVIDERKRETLTRYRDLLAEAMDTTKPNVHQLLKAIEAYIRAEEKDRNHGLRRFKHLLISEETEKIKQYKVELQFRLIEIDQRIRDSIGMLNDYPNLVNKLKPEAMEYWQNFRNENTPDVHGYRSLTNLNTDIDQLIIYYEDEFGKDPESEVKIRIGGESEDIAPPKVATDQPSISSELYADSPQEPFNQAVEETTFTVRRFGSPMFLAISAGLVLVLIGMVMVLSRKRRYRSRGFIEVSLQSPEDKTLAAMQGTGYENPTYLYMEKS